MNEGMSEGMNELSNLYSVGETRVRFRTQGYIFRQLSMFRLRMYGADSQVRMMVINLLLVE